MTDLQEWEKLSAKWQKYVHEVSMAQKGIDIEVTHCLLRILPCPNLEQQKKLDGLRKKEAVARAEMDAFIRERYSEKYVYSKPVVNAEGGLDFNVIDHLRNVYPVQITLEALQEIARTKSGKLKAVDPEKIFKKHSEYFHKTATAMVVTGVTSPLIVITRAMV